MSAQACLWGAAAALILAGLAKAQVPAELNGRLSTAQSDYIEHCAGCHGVQGRSTPARVPQLRDRAGYFLCTAAGREYLIRLPNVSHVAIPDPAELADLMNYVTFSLGGKSAPPGARPYVAEEVARLRRTPLRSGASLVAMRRTLAASLIKECGAPRDLIDPYAASSQSR